MPQSSGIKRACDACHRRKAKCIGDGNQPCQNCTQAGLECTYNAVPQKKGPKGSRAKVISELKETQHRQSHLTSPTSQTSFSFGSPPTSPSISRSTGILSSATIRQCVNFFFTHLYPTQPILHRQLVQQAVVDMDRSPEAYCMITVLCAYMMIQPDMDMPSQHALDSPTRPTAKLTTANVLLHDALQARKNVDYVENPCLLTLITSFFLFGSYFCLERNNQAWFHLREATTLAHIMGLHDESTYQSGDFIESSRSRRLYWLLFVTERAYAIQRHRPITLQATIELPRVDEDPAEATEIKGFIHLVNLFWPLDDTFMGLWNKTRVGGTTAWLAKLQQQLSDALPAYLEGTECQLVDLRTSQQWLRMMVWQLCISQGFLSSTAADQSLTFQFPLEISRDLAQMSAHFTQQEMEVHGIGLVEKLFDIACTLVDVLAVIPFEPLPYEFGPRDYLNQLVAIISQLRGGQQRYLPLILTKMDEVLPPAVSALPGMAPLAPQLSRSDVPESYLSDGSDPAHAASSYGSPLSQTGSQPKMKFAEIIETFSPREAFAADRDEMLYNETPTSRVMMPHGAYHAPAPGIGGFPG